MQAARSNEPPDMAKAIRKREAKQDAKRKKQREKEAAAGRGPEAQLAGPDSDNKLKIQITSYGSGVPKFVEEFEAAVEDDEDVMDDVEEDIDPMQVLPSLMLRVLTFHLGFQLSKMYSKFVCALMAHSFSSLLRCPFCTCVGAVTATGHQHCLVVHFMLA